MACDTCGARAYFHCARPHTLHARGPRAVYASQAIDVRVVVLASAHEESNKVAQRVPRAPWLRLAR